VSQPPPWLGRLSIGAPDVGVHLIAQDKTAQLYSPPSPLSGSHDDPDSILARLPIGTHDYIRVLGAIIKKKNHEHAKKHKGVSHKTIYERERFLVRFFRELRRETKYNNLDPRQLANRHIQVMVERRVARGLHTATIHNYLSFLRTYASWISKAGMVREPEFYVGNESPHAHRTQVAAEDKSWSAKNVDVEAKIREITAFDTHVGRQLELCIRFALRPKEARHFRPHGAIIPSEQAIPRDAAPFPECREFVRVRHGTRVAGRAMCLCRLPSSASCSRAWPPRWRRACLSASPGIRTCKASRASTTSSASSASRRRISASSLTACATRTSTTAMRASAAQRRRSAAARVVLRETTLRGNAPPFALVTRASA
jgi:Phage integrase, N-terminal